jgi:hypothetical protein
MADIGPLSRLSRLSGLGNGGLGLPRHRGEQFLVGNSKRQNVGDPHKLVFELSGILGQLHPREFIHYQLAERQSRLSRIRRLKEIFWAGRLVHSGVMDKTNTTAASQNDACNFTPLFGSGELKFQLKFQSMPDSG